MQLVTLERCIFDVLALPTALEEMDEIPRDRLADYKGLKVKFTKFAEAGTQKITSAGFHEANKREGIWAFIHGRHRAYCFYDGPSLIVVTSVVMKKNQAPDRKVIRHACRTRDAYFEAKESGQLIID